MKTYPSIPTKIDFKHEYVVFDKIDGSNIRAEWNDKQGFYKFGSRNQLLTEQQTQLFPSIDLIVEKYEDELSERFDNAKIARAICFFEYYGPNSFAGSHPDPVEDMTVTLIDINPYKKGIMLPDEFVDFCDGIDIPRIVHEGKIDEEFIDSVKNSQILDMTFEGVVGKAINVKHHHMTKIKTRKWLDKLKEFCNNDPVLFNRLK